MALYHKHRPQNFASVVGQDHIITTLTNQITQERVAHAYLFSGPRGVGKTTTARLLAKAVNCQNRKNKDSEPCEKCQSCQEISASHAIDVIEIDAASYTGVDNVRDNIIDNAQFRPTKSKCKIFIIDEVHMLSIAAFNALLKILEEPPEYIIFILATTELHKIPETILSRCQRFDFKRVPYEEMKKYLEKIAKEEKVKIDKEVLDKIINKSDSCVRDAVSLLDQIMATGEKHLTTEVSSVVLPSSNTDDTSAFVSNLIEKNATEALKQINQLTEEGINLNQFATDVVELLRVMMISSANLKTNSLSLDLSEETAKKLAKLNKKITPTEIISLIDMLLKRRQEIKNSPIPQLPLELAVIAWCNPNNTVGLPTNPPKNNDSTTPKHIHIDEEKKEEKIIQPPQPTTTQTETPEIKHSSFSIEDVKNKWDEFVVKIEKKSTSLAFILKSSSIERVSGDTICFSVGFSLHRDKIMDKTCQRDIEALFSELLNTRVKIEAIVNESQIDAEKEVDSELQDLTAAFGGEIIS